MNILNNNSKLQVYQSSAFENISFSKFIVMLTKKGQ